MKQQLRYKVLKINANMIYKNNFQLNMDADQIEMKLIDEQDNGYFRAVRLFTEMLNLPYLEQIIFVDCSYNKVECNGTYCEWVKSNYKSEFAILEEKIKVTTDKKKLEKLELKNLIGIIYIINILLKQKKFVQMSKNY